GRSLTARQSSGRAASAGAALERDRRTYPGGQTVRPSAEERAGRAREVMDERAPEQARVAPSVCPPPPPIGADTAPHSERRLEPVQRLDEAVDLLQRARLVEAPLQPLPRAVVVGVHD